MSLGVSSRTLLLGKLLGTSAAVGLVALPAILIGVGVLTFGLPGDNAQAGQRGLLLLLFYLLYALAFLFLTLGVSAVARPAKGALIALIGFWAMAAFIRPNIGRAVCWTRGVPY